MSRANSILLMVLGRLLQFVDNAPRLRTIGGQTKPQKHHQMNEPKLQPYETAYSVDDNKFYMRDDTGKYIEVSEAIARFAEVLAERDKLGIEVKTLVPLLERARNERNEAREEVEWYKKEMQILKKDLAAALAAEERAKKSRDEAWCRANEAKAEAQRSNSNTRPEPSRLEIAARIVQEWAANPEVALKQLDSAKAYRTAFCIADNLIAAAKEAQK